MMLLLCMASARGDTVKLAGALTGIALFDSAKGAAADATTPVAVVDDKIYMC